MLNLFFFLLTVITGQHRSGVVSARTRIDVLLLTFRRKQPFTHFLAFFLNEAEVQERFLKFQEARRATFSFTEGQRRPWEGVVCFEADALSW